MTDYQALARADAIAAGINPDVYVAQIQAESGFNPGALSPSGAIGIAQFMPGTAAGIGFDPHDPTASLKQGAFLDARNSKAYGGDYEKMLAAYNAGNGPVDSAVSRSSTGWFSFLPAETQKYVHNILGTGSFLGINKCGPQDCDCIYGAGTDQAKQCNGQLMSTKGGIGAGIVNTGGAAVGVTPSGQVVDPITSAIQAAFQPFFDALPAFGIKAGLFMAALMFAIIGFWVLTRNNTMGVKV